MDPTLGPDKKALHGLRIRGASKGALRVQMIQWSSRGFGIIVEYLFGEYMIIRYLGPLM